MSHEVLIADLQHKSGQRVKEIWRKAEKELDGFREQKRLELELRQNEVMAQLKEVREEVAAPLLHQARGSALAIEDASLARLAERLYSKAVGALDQLRRNDYETLFARLVQEVSGEQWDSIAVNPQDMELARSFFPGVEIVADSSIVGGYRASVDNGRYIVVNTLKKRLEKSWPTYLPHLLYEVVEAQNAEPAG